MRFSDLVGVDKRPEDATTAVRAAVDTDTYLNELASDPRNNGFVSGLLDHRRAKRFTASRRGFLRGTIAAAAATTAVSAASLFGPARKVEAQSGVVGTYPRRILQYCPPYNSGDNCQPGCGSSPICTDCCGSDGYFRNEPANGYTLYAGGCGDGDIADGWLWRFSGKCGNCAAIEYRCSDGYVQTDTGPAPFICRSVTDCVPLPEGEEAGPELVDAARDTNWRPAGSLELAVDQGGSVVIQGWVSDGSGVPIQIRIRSNNQIVHWGTAALARPDISASRRGSSPNVGFGVSFPLDPGDYEFCVDALEGPLTATIGCVRMNVGGGGSVAGSGITGSLPNTAGNDSDGISPAGAPTPSEVVLPVRGALSQSPTLGAVQVIRRSGATTGFVSGWAGDPDVEDAAFIEVSVDGVSTAVIQTDLPRPDVAAAFSGFASTTGFAVTFPLPVGAARVHVVAISPDDGRRQPLGFQDLGPTPQDATDERAGRPTPSGPSTSTSDVVYGGIDAVDITDAGIAVAGWSFDPNDRDRVITVRAEAAGFKVVSKTGLVNPGAQEIYGVHASCGFELLLVLPAGLHDLSVTAVGANGGTSMIDQRTVAVP
ncbi:MAG: hypothetical protein ACI8XD_001911 [Thermoproteota archaeon]